MLGDRLGDGNVCHGARCWSRALALQAAVTTHFELPQQFSQRGRIPLLHLKSYLVGAYATQVREVSGE